MLNDFGIHGMVGGWKIFIGGKMGTVPAIAQELAVNVQTDDVCKYLAAVLRTYRELGEPNDRLIMTINRVGFDEFKKTVKSKLEQPYDDLILEAKKVREKEKNAECIDHT
jgi:dissimilatory sulfite reductase (desulfoviridin) alpha/beta subunit